jgi:hypothetical protein
MLAEFLDRLAKMATEANAVQVIESEALRKIIVREGQKVTLHDIPPVERSGFLDGVEDLILAAQDEDMSPDPEIFHNDCSITLVCDRNDRHEAMQMPLRYSSRWKVLNKLAQDQESMPARRLIQLLRFELSGSGIDGVVAALRKIDFTRRSDGSSNVQHGRESLGRSVEAAVQQAENVPETFDVTVPVILNHGLRDATTVSVQCGVHIDVHDETIMVRPLADELMSAQLRAQAAIGTLLRDRLTDVPIFYGEPAP